MRAKSMVFGAALISVLMSALIILDGGAVWRIPADRLHPTSVAMREEESALCLGSHVRDGEELGSRPGEPLVTCAHDIGADGDIFVWGDSHARHLVGGLADAFPGLNVRIMYFTSCQPQSGAAAYVYRYEGRQALARGCVDRNERARAYFASAPPSRVILHHYFGYEGQFSPQWHAATEEVIAFLERLGHKVVLFGGIPYPGAALGTCLSVPRTIPDDRLEIRCRGDASLARMITARNEELAAAFPGNFVDPTDFFCPDGGACRATDGPLLLFRDAHHLTVAGSRALLGHVGPRLASLLDL